MDTIYNNTSEILFINSDIIWARNIPTVITSPLTELTRTSVLGNGIIDDTGGENSSRRGFCYKIGSTGDPTISDSVVYEDGDFGRGDFSKLVNSLIEGNTYQIRAYSINSEGVGYGTTIYFLTRYDFAETIIIIDNFSAVLFTDIARLFRDIILPEKIREIIDSSRIRQVLLSEKEKQVTSEVRERQIESEERKRQVLCTPINLQGEDDMLEFSPKQSYEEYFVVFNFARVITPLTEIESVDVKAYDASEVDVTSTFTDQSKTSVTGTKVYVWVRDGSEQVYKLTCKIVMDNGEKFEQDATIEVVEV